MAERLRDSLTRHLGELAALPTDRLLAGRQQRLRGFGVYGGT
jgi:acetyl-CoA carboxylase alpha subunit